MSDETSVMILIAAGITLLAYVTAMRFDIEERAIVSPLRVWAALGIVTTVPYMVTLAFRVLRPDPLVEKALWAGDYSELLVRYAILNAAAVLAMVLGYRANAGVLVGNAGRSIPTSISAHSELRVAVVCLVVGGLMWALMLYKAGGLWALLTNIKYRSQILSGVGYLMQFGSSLLSIGALLGFYSAGKSGSRWKLAAWILVLVAVALSLSVTGGRKGTIYLVIGSVLIWHYCVRPIQRVSAPLVLVGGLLLAYFVVVMSIRTLGGVDVVLYSPHMLLLAIRDSVSWMFANLSYIDTYVYVMAHFQKAGYWFGATFLDLGSVWLPSSITPDKPPVDDGVYLRSLAEGFVVSPGAAAASLYPSSWPPETFGMGYMSFGAAGVLLLSLLLGVAIRTSLEFARVQRFSFVSVFLFSQVLLNFEITNLRLVQMVTTVVTLVGVLLISFVLRPVRQRSNNRCADDGPVEVGS